MTDRRLEQLLRQLVELEDLLEKEVTSVSGPGGRPHAAAGAKRTLFLARWAAPVAAAAALAAALVWPHPRTPTAVAVLPEGRPARGMPVTMARQPHRGPGSPGLERFQSCAEEDAYALVLLRAWNSECSCITWHLHEFEDGSRVARLPAGEEVAISFWLGDHPPPVEQMVLLAVARHLADLPTDPESADLLLECLNRSLPPDQPGVSQAESPQAVVACVSSDVQIVPQTFVPR